MKTKILALMLMLTMTCLTMNASVYKEYMQFSGKVGTENIVGGITIMQSKTYGTYSYVQGGLNNVSPFYDLRCTSSKTIGQRKYKINFDVEFNGKKCGTWSITYDAIAKKITGTMKDENGKTLKIDLHEWRVR